MVDMADNRIYTASSNFSASLKTEANSAINIKETDAQNAQSFASQSLKPNNNQTMGLLERANLALANLKPTNFVATSGLGEALSHIQTQNSDVESTEYPKNPNKPYEVAERVIIDLHDAEEFMHSDASEFNLTNQELLQVHHNLIARLEQTFDLVSSCDYGNGMNASDADTLKAHLSETIDALHAHCENLQDLEIVQESQKHAEPASLQKIAQFKHTQYENAINMLKSPAFAKVSPATKASLIEKIRVAESRLLTTQFGGAESLNSKKSVQQYMGKKSLSSFNIGDVMAKKEIAKLGKNGGDIPIVSSRVNDKTILAQYISAFVKANDHVNINPKKIEKAFQENYAEHFNTRPWQPIEKEFSVQVGGKSVGLISQIIPSGKMANLQDEYARHGINGVNSGSTKETRHAANLWASKLASSDGELMFAGYRHASLDPYRVSDKAMRETGALNRAKEALSVMVQDQLEDPEKLHQFLEQAKQNNGVIPVKIMSTNLESPSFWQAGKKDSEYNQVKNQTNAWQQLSTEPQSVKIKDQDGNEHILKVQVEVMPFNVPVNIAAFNKLMGVQGGADKLTKDSLTQLLGDLKSSRPVEAMDSELGRLIQKINIAMADADVPEIRAALSQKREILIKLGIQIKNIFNENAHHQSTTEPYKLASRLVALASEMAIARDAIGEFSLTGNFYNCKSGKDRTSQVDAEAKDIITQAKYDTIRDFNETRNPEEQKRLRQFQTNVGNHEIQEMNVGVAGYKLRDVDSLLKEIGLQKDTAFQYWGLSGYANS